MKNCSGAGDRWSLVIRPPLALDLLSEIGLHLIEFHFENMIVGGGG